MLRFAAHDGSQVEEAARVRRNHSRDVVFGSDVARDDTNPPIGERRLRPGAIEQHDFADLVLVAIGATEAAAACQRLA